MIIQPLASLIPAAHHMNALNIMAVGEALFKAAQLSTDKTLLPRAIPCLSTPLFGLSFQALIAKGTEWDLHDVAAPSGTMDAPPGVRVCFQIINNSLFNVMWQVWSFSSDPNEHPSLILPHGTSLLATSTAPRFAWPMVCITCDHVMDTIRTCYSYWFEKKPSRYIVLRNFAID